MHRAQGAVNEDDAFRVHVGEGGLNHRAIRLQDAADAVDVIVEDRKPDAPLYADAYGYLPSYRGSTGHTHSAMVYDVVGDEDLGQPAGCATPQIDARLRPPDRVPRNRKVRRDVGCTTQTLDEDARVCRGVFRSSRKVTVHEIARNEAFLNKPVEADAVLRRTRDRVPDQLQTQHLIHSRTDCLDPDLAGVRQAVDGAVRHRDTLTITDDYTRCRRSTQNHGTARDDMPEAGHRDAAVEPTNGARIDRRRSFTPRRGGYTHADTDRASNKVDCRDLAGVDLHPRRVCDGDTRVRYENDDIPKRGPTDDPAEYDACQPRLCSGHDGAPLHREVHRSTHRVRNGRCQGNVTREGDV